MSRKAHFITYTAAASWLLISLVVHWFCLLPQLSTFFGLKISFVMYVHMYGRACERDSHLVGESDLGDCASFIFSTNTRTCCTLQKIFFLILCVLFSWSRAKRVLRTLLNFSLLWKDGKGKSLMTIWRVWGIKLIKVIFWVIKVHAVSSLC